MLGEYEFTGLTPVVAGVLFGLVVSEFVLQICTSPRPIIGIVTGVMVAFGLGWAAWISSDEGLRPFPALAWLAMGVGGGVAAVRTGWPAGRARRLVRDVRAAE
jgi:dolichol kinase